MASMSCGRAQLAELDFKVQSVGQFGGRRIPSGTIGMDKARPHALRAG